MKEVHEYNIARLALAPTDIVVVTVPGLTSGEEAERIELLLKDKGVENEVVVVGFGVTLSVLSQEEL